MRTADLLTLLKKHLPEEQWSWVIAALQQDETIWTCLHQDDFFAQALALPNPAPARWQPGSLALLSLGVSLTPEDLRRQPLTPLDKGLRQKSYRAYEALLKKAAAAEEETAGEQASFSLDLPTAGWLALTLRERVRLTGSWKDFSIELLRQSGVAASTWRTPLACLYALVPEPLELLKALIHPNSSRDEIQLMLHALLSQPAPESEQLAQLQAACERLFTQANEALLVLADLTAELASRQPAIAKQFACWITSWVKPDQLPGGGCELSLPHLSLAELHLQAGQALAAREILEKEKRQQAWLETNLEGMLAFSRQLEASPAGSNPENSDGLAAWESDLRKLTSQTDESPSQLFTAAQAAYHLGDLATAQERALKALDAIKRAEKETTTDFIPQLDHLLKERDRSLCRQLATFLAETGRLPECLQAARLVLAHQPTDFEMVALCGRVAKELHQFDEAIPYLQIASMLSPQHLETRQHLAEALERNLEWDAALEERKTIVALLGDASPQQMREALLNQAGCAIEARQFTCAQEACRQVLSFLPEDGEAYVILGKIAELEGDFTGCQELYQQALNLAPQLSSAWLGLAKAQENSGQTSLALETLKEAVQAAPNDYELHYHLGLAWTAQGALTQACHALEQAASLAAAEGRPSWKKTPPADVAFELSQVKGQLGHTSEAHAILESAYVNDPEAKAHPHLPYAYARSLIAQGQTCQAIPVLQQVIARRPEEVKPYFDYARLLLQTGEQPNEALSALHHILEKDPCFDEAQALLAEAHEMNGDHVQAMQAYQAALETDLAADPAWFARMSAGLGKAAMRLGQTETALASLQEAIQADSQQAAYHRLISDAYWQAGLVNNALQSAHAALNLEPNHPDSLLWFAERALQIHQAWTQQDPNRTIEVSQGGAQTKPLHSLKPRQLLLEALNALEQAAQAAPERYDIALRKAELQIMTDETQGALETLDQLRSYDDLSSTVLLQTASLLMKMNDGQRAATTLERAIIAANREGVTLPVEVRENLAHAYLMAGNPAKAAETWQNAIQENPQDVKCYLSLARVLVENHEIKAALKCLLDALAVITDPEGRSQIQRSLTIIYRQEGKPGQALLHAAQAAQQPKNETNQPVPACWQRLELRRLAAEIARSLLCEQTAQQYLTAEPWMIAEYEAPLPSESATRQAVGAFFSLKAELALEAGEEIEAANALTWAIKADPQHPRALALQARFQYRQRDEALALATYQEAAKLLASGDARSEDFSGMAEAARELNQWEDALHWAKRACQANPAEPFWQLNLARLLALRAELQHICQMLEVVNHAPGAEALGKGSSELYFQSLHLASQQLDHASKDLSEQDSWLVQAIQQAELGLQKWHSRGQAFFEALPASPDGSRAASASTRTAWDEFKEQPDFLAAFMIDLARKRFSSRGQTNPAKLKALIEDAIASYPHLPALLLSAALALFSMEEAEALALAQKVCHRLSSSSPMVHALSLALLARIAEKLNDPPLTIQYINTALNLWANEPRWHALAARAHAAEDDPLLRLPNQSKAIEHLETAVRLEGNYPPHYLALGKTLLQSTPEDAASAQRAMQAFETASHLDPDEPEAWLWLAQACYKQGGDGIAQAAHFAERAVSLANDRQESVYVSACQLAAEAALSLKKPQRALQLADQALAKRPDAARPILLKAMALDELKKPIEALHVLEDAPETARRELLIRLKQAELRYQTQGAPAALAILTPLAEENPQEPGVLALLARILVEAGKLDEAAQAAQMALQACSGNGCQYPLEKKEKAAIHHLVGKLSGNAGQLDRAVFHLNEAIRCYPEGVEPYLDLGFTYQKQRQYLKAQNIFQQATQVAPDDPRPFIHAGLALKEGKDYAAAEAMLKRAAQLAPNDVQVRKHLAAVAALNLVHNPRSRVTIEG